MWKPFQYRRLVLLGALLLLGFGCLGARLYHLIVRRQSELTAKAKALTNERELLVPWRGGIVARDGAVLAATLPVKTVYADLELCGGRLDEAIRVAAALLGIEPRAVRRRLQGALLEAMRRSPDDAPAGAVALKRNVTGPEWIAVTNALAHQTFGFGPARLSRAEARQLTRLQRSLLFAEDDQRRLYPFGSLACHVLGNTIPAADGCLLRGAGGIELSLDSVLAGQPGVRVSERDATGRELPQRRRALQPARDGGRVMLTLDLRLQELAEQALDELVARSKPANAALLVVRPSTGEILAWACRPSFQPAAPGASAPEDWLNRPLWAAIEPGSTFKTFTLAAALDDGAVALDQVVHCGNGRKTWNGAVFTDRGLVFGWVPMREAFARSLNTAHVELAIRLGRERFYHHVTNFGFGRLAGIPLPGERPGFIGALTNRMGAAHAYAAFGQGISVTQLQMTMAFCAVVNGGVLMKPMLVGRIRDDSGRIIWQARPTPVRRVLKAETSLQMREALQAAVSPNSTGRLAATADYLSGGKTGTAEKAGPNGRGYLSGRYIASFVGAIPIRNPELVISIVVDEPQGAYGGGSVAAPLFSQLASESARLLGVPPETPALLTSTRN